MRLVQVNGVRALQVATLYKIWITRVVTDYENVHISDMSSSFRNGLAFCAILHHFRPHLLDYNILQPENVLENNSLAFQIAEEELGLTSLLDPRDMLENRVPDKFSVITYVSQFYHLFKDEDDSRLAVRQLQDYGLDASPAA